MIKEKYVVALIILIITSFIFKKCYYTSISF